MAEGTRRHIAVESCAIARPEISGFLPALKQMAASRLPQNYRSANLVVKTDDEGKIHWGGIGRRSLRLPEKDYFWTEIEGQRIFYSLDTFFQANLGILTPLIQTLRPLLSLTPQTCLLDLYAGVGLFWVVFASEVKGVWAVEESGSAICVAEHNLRYHGFSNVFLREGKTEDCSEEILAELAGAPLAAIVDPPRQGLSPRALGKLSQARTLNPLIYVSCHPNALVRDLRGFLTAGWRADRIVPIDFFPKTRHLEVVVRLEPEGGRAGRV
jgi:tRNA/tmRNA/rRNA uracil-C5-methylase (TrmA/RlmC/RlmD family)